VTTVADGLVARGLVERLNDTQDRRRVNHALTDAGRELLHHADEVIDSGLGAVVEHLDPEGARGIAAGFRSLQVLLEKVLDEHSS
jgi:DNA-binding MarR family transcriptional regulator